MPVWSADVEVDEPLVRRLLAQFPELELRSLRRLAEGWDNSVWVVNERYAFRIPRRKVAVPGLEREVAVLPRLAPLLPLPIPRPAFIGRPDGDYAWPFFGCELIAGLEAGDAGLDDQARVCVGLELARFLRALHSVEPDEALPEDPNARADTVRRAAMAREELAELARLGVWRAPPEIEAVLAQAEGLPPPEAPVVAHGDLHFRHLLVANGAASGVIDWGDVCIADPAVDLPLLWSFVPPRGRAAFLDTYGPVSEAQLVRARVLAIQLSAVLAHYGHVEGVAGVEREGLAGLERALDARLAI